MGFVRVWVQVKAYTFLPCIDMVFAVEKLDVGRKRILDHWSFCDLNNQAILSECSVEEKIFLPKEE